MKRLDVKKKSGEWAERFAPELLGLKKGDLDHLHDDRVGRSLDRLFQANVPELVLDVERNKRCQDRMALS